jgi:mRNA interferase MazF
MRSDLKPGDILLISLPEHSPKGHEQEGERPVIVVAVPKFVRYPVVIVVPLTTKDGSWVNNNPYLYRRIPKNASGLPKDSIALIDQIRAVDVHRIISFYGSLDKSIFLMVHLIKVFFRKSKKV